MNYLLKQTVYRSVGLTGLYRYHRRKNRDKAIVLTYHGVVPEIPADGIPYEYRNFVTVAQFEQHIRFFLKHYRPLTVDDFTQPERDIRGGFLITFDDGFRNNLRYAAPVLNRHGVQGCFFITTRLVGTRAFLWTEEVTRLLYKTRRPRLAFEGKHRQAYDLADAGDRERASEVIRRYMKGAGIDEREAMLSSMREQLDDVSPEMDPAEAERYLFMTWDEVRELAASGQQIGSHTHTHPVLSTLSETESQTELERSKALLEEHLGQPVHTMSYPNGEARDFSEVQKRQLKALGYRCAFSQIPLFNTPQTDPFALRRFNISLSMPVDLIEAKISGFSS